MNILNLCEAISNNSSLLKGHFARSNKNDHSFIEQFQDGITRSLQEMDSKYSWKTEHRFDGSIKDSVDIFGSKRGDKDWIIEIDATRADQVAKKFVSRLALGGLSHSIVYVAVLYKSTQEDPSQSKKFLYYQNLIAKKISKESEVLGIYVDCHGDIELWNFDFKHNPINFEVNQKNVVGMTRCCEYVVTEFIKTHKSITFAKLSEIFGKFVSDNVGGSRYNKTNQILNGKVVHTYTQFRGIGKGSNWDEFVNLCKKIKVSINEKRCLYSDGLLNWKI